MPLEKMSEKFRGKSDDIYVAGSEGTTPESSETMPVVPHKVLYAGVPFYSDEACQNRVEGATIAILRPLDPDGFEVTEVAPTRKSYAPGQYLTWHLNNKKMWEDCYYRNPQSGQVEQAWTIHVEYVGRVLSEDCLAKNREKLDELEAKYPEKSESTVM